MKFKATLCILLVAASFRPMAYAAELGNVRISDISGKAAETFLRLTEQFRSAGSFLQDAVNEGVGNNQEFQNAEEVSKKTFAQLLDRGVLETVLDVSKKTIATGKALFVFLKESFTSLWAFIQKVIGIFKD